LFHGFYDWLIKILDIVLVPLEEGSLDEKMIKIHKYNYSGSSTPLPMLGERVKVRG